MPIEWTSAELEQNRLMNRARSGRTVPKGVKSATCEECGARRSVLALYRWEGWRRACRSCITGIPAADTYVAAVARKARKAPAPVVSAPEPVADPEPARGQRNDDGEPDAAGYAAAHDFGDVCACSDCIGDDPEPADLAAVKATVRAAGLVDNPRPTTGKRRISASRRASMAVLMAYGGRPADPAPIVAPEPIPAPVFATLAAEAIAEAMSRHPARVLPVAPVLAAVPTDSDARPSCPRCGQLFRKSGAGLAWHLANRPDCAPVAPVLAAVK